MKKKLTKAIVLSILTMCALGITSSVSAEEKLFSDFVKSVDSGGNIVVSENTTVNADELTPSGDTYWKAVAISPYKLEVKKGAELVLNDLITYNPQITGEGDIVINKTNVSSTYKGGYGHGIVLTSLKPYMPGMSENVSIKANSLTINVGIEGPAWTAKGIMVPNGERGRIDIEVADGLSVHARSAAIHTEGNTETPINITAKNVELRSDGDWTVNLNGSSTLDIVAEERVDINSRSGITNNSTGAINISSKVFTSNSMFDALSAGNGNITIETVGDNTLTATGTDAPTKYGSAGFGVHAKNATIKLISTTGNNKITAGLDGLHAAKWSSAGSGSDILGPNARIEVSGVNNIIKAERYGAFTLGGNIEATASNDNLIEAETGLYADTGNITFNAGNNTVINATDKAMYATNHGVTKVFSENLTQMIGDVVANSFGSATAGFDSEKSYLLGAVHTDGGSRNLYSTTDLTFTNGATWYLTADSNVSDLTLANGIVDLTEQVKNNEKVNAHQVSIDRALNGSGLFKLDLTYIDNDVEDYMNAKNSDFIYIYGGDNSEQNIEFAVTDENLGAMESGDKLYFAQVHNDGAHFGQGETIRKANADSIYDNQYRIDFDEHEEVIAAAYSLEDSAGGNDDGSGEKPTEIVPMYSDWYITCEKGGINPNGETPVQSYNAGFALWRDDDTLLKRLGELRYTNDEGGVWTRVIGKKLEDNRAMGFNTHAKTVQVGYDRKDVQEDGSGTWRKGIAIGHTWADTSFSGGEGKNNYTDLSIYATNIRKHDHYLDLVARFGRINSDYDTVYGDHGEFDNWAGSLSAEYGRKKQMNEDNWFIEPQAQLTYSYMWGDSYTTRKGVRVEQDNADSLVGRAGFIISKELESERKYPNRYYAKAFIMHEFLDGGDNTVSLGSDRFYAGSDFKDTWYVVGVGANADMGNQCTFYFDAEKNFKAHVKMPYRIEAGFRWEF